MADGGMSFMTGAFAAGAAAPTFSGFAGAAEPAGFSVIDGFASSSAMMRRMDAKISSMEGSWTFAGCVISDSTSSTSSHAFYTNKDRICRFQICRLGFSSHKPDLSPDQAPLDRSQGPRPRAEHRSVAAKGCQTWRESLCCPRKGTSGQLLIASNALTNDPPTTLFGRRPSSAASDDDG